MFNRRLMIFIVLLTAALGLLWWRWQSPGGESLQTASSSFSSARYSQDLSGYWERFSSLREAWTTESDLSKGRIDQSGLLTRQSINLPSSERIAVVSKRFRIPGEWSSRTMILTINGVQGRAAVYLNGIAGSQKIGEFEGSGGADELEIPAKAFRYGEDNILLVELTGSAVQREMLFGSSWPPSGRITGGIRLEAVVETSLPMPRVNVSWPEVTTAQVTVTFSLQRRGFVQEGPWQIYGVLSDGSAEIAEQTLTVKAQEDTNNHPVTLSFTVPEVRRWTTQDPFFYHLYLTVVNSSGDVDNLTLTLGLRSLTRQAGNWVLNGQVLPIKGIALTPQEEFGLRHTEQLEEWLAVKQQEGVNLVYFIGQIPDEIWLNAADQVGMGVWVELPVELILSSRLPQPEVFQQMITAKNLHPSLWAWTVGKGLNSDDLAQKYLRECEEEVQPNLAYTLQITPDFPEQTVEGVLYAQENKLQGTWGEVSAVPPETASPLWLKEKRAAMVWAVVMIFLLTMNIGSITWPYSEIAKRKAKRRLRRAWFWNWWFALARQILLAGLVTSGLFRIPTHFNAWFAHLWPLVDLLQAQSPWLIWAALSALFMFVRFLHVGVAAPHLPNDPHPVALVYWLERRYYFTVLVSLGWALLPWGFPYYVPILGYIFFVILFLPFRIRDIRRIGGRYRAFLWVPGIMAAVLIVWAALHYADFMYLWQMKSQWLGMLWEALAPIQKWR